MKNKIGTILIVLYFIQFFISFKLDFLENLQSIELYKKCSGLFIFILILSQWLLSLLRYNKRITTKNKELYINIHKWIGVFLPLAFYIHSTRLGYAVLLFLSIVFFLNLALGFLNTDKLIQKHPKLFNWWLVLHIFFSVLILVLVIIHIWTVFVYN